MKKYISLIEALGLIFALVSWWLSWSSVQRWNDRIDSFVGSIEIHQRQYEGLHLSNLIEYEASVSRASRNFKLTGATTTFDYDYAWQFAIVRAKSAKIRENTVSYVETMISLIENASIAYNISEAEQLQKAKTKLENLIDYIKKNSSQEIFGENYPPIFIASEVSANDANNIHSELKSIDEEIADSGVALVEALKYRKKLASTWFTVFFILGSVLAVSSKIINFKAESEKKIKYSI